MQWRIRRALRWAVPAAILVFGLPALGDLVNGWWKSEGACTLSYVVDGDTVGMICPRIDAHRLRFDAVDAPELEGACLRERWLAVRARFFLQGVLFRAERIEIVPTTEFDRYNRMLSDVLVDGTSLQTRLLEAGLAVPYGTGRPDWCRGQERGDG